MIDADSITIMLVDDHPLLRAGFVMALQSHPEFCIVAETENPKEAVNLYQDIRPKIVVMDILFQGEKSGLDATKEILHIDQNAKVIVMTQHDQDQIIKEAYRVGAKAFINKNQDPNQLVSVIKEVAKGKLFFLPEIAQRLAAMTVKCESTPSELLSNREYEVFKFIAEGNTIYEIAEKLGVSHKTANNASQSLKQKLGISRTADLTRHAIRYGVIQL